MIIENHRGVAFIKMAQPVLISGKPTGSPELTKAPAETAGQLTACRNLPSKTLLLHDSRTSAEYSLGAPVSPPIHQRIADTGEFLEEAS